MAANKERRRKAYEIMNGNASEAVKSSGSENNRRATAYAIMNQNTRDQRDKEQEQLRALAEQRAKEEQQKHSNLGNLAYRAAKVGTKLTSPQIFSDKLSKKAAENLSSRKYSDSYSLRDSNQRAVLNSEDKKRINQDTLLKIENSDWRKFAASQAGKSSAKRDLENLGITEESDATRQVENIYAENAVVNAEKALKNKVSKSADDIKNMSADELKNFTPNSKEEAEAYLKVAEENAQYRRVPKSSMDDVMGLIDPYEGTDQTTIKEYPEYAEKAFEYARSYGIELDANQMATFESLYQEKLDKEEEQEKEEQEKKLEKERNAFAEQAGQLKNNSAEFADSIRNLSLDELKSFEPNSKEEAYAFYDYINTENFSSERNAATGDLIGADDYKELYDKATGYAVEYDFATDGEKEYFENKDKSFGESFEDFLQNTGLTVENLVFGAINGVESGSVNSAAGVAKPLYNTLDWATGETFGTGKLHEQAQIAENTAIQAHEEALEYNKRVMSPKVAEIVTMLEEAVGQALTNVSMAEVTGGTGKSVTPKSLGKNASLNISGNTVQKTMSGIAERMKQYAKNPMFTTTFISEAGEAYEDAIESGASKQTALTNAFTVGYLNGLIEMGGGLETGETNFLKDAIDEGMEEIWQGSLSKWMAKATYASDLPLISLDGSDAIYNVKELALSFLGGVVGGAAGGGIVTGINNAVNPVMTSLQNKVYGDTLKTDTNTLSQYARIAVENGSKRDVNTANEIMLAIQNGTLDEIPSVKVGRFAQNSAKLYQNKYIAAIAQEESGTNIKEKTKSAAEIYNTLQNIYTNPEFILNDTRAVMIRKNKVAAEALSRSSGLNSTINAQTPVSTVKTIARMVSNGVNVNNNQSINVDSTGRVSSTVSPAQIDVNAAQRIKNGSGSMSDYLSVTGKALDDYRDSTGEVNADTLRREAHEIIDNNGILADVDNSALSEISNSRRMLNNIQNGSSQSQNGVEIENISGMRSVSPQNIVEIKDGDLTLDNGRTVSAESAPLTNDAQALYTASARYKDNAVATAFINGYDGYGGLDVETYAKNFDGVYNVYKAQGGAKLTDEFRDKSTEAFKSRMGTKAYNAAKQAGIKARKSNERNIEGKKKSSQKATESGKKYSIKYDKNNTPYVVIEEDILDGVSENDIIKVVSDNIRDNFSHDGIYVGNQHIKVTQVSRNEITRSKTTAYYRANENTIFKDKMRATNNLDEIVWASRNYVNEDINHNRKDNIVAFGRGKVLLSVGGNEYIADVLIGQKKDNSLVFYDIIKIAKTTINKKEAARQGKRHTVSTKNSITEKTATVNTNISSNSRNDTKGAVTESYKQEWTLSAKEKTAESVIKQIANEYTKRGINVDIVYEENGNNGQWDPKTNTVTVNLAANNPIEVFFHEAMGHVIHDYANENWQDIKSAAFTYMASLEDVSIDDIRNHKIDQYKKNGLSYTSELIDEEIVSDMIGAMAQDKNSVQKLYNSLIANGTEETLAQKIVRKLKELLIKLKLHFVDLNGKYNSAIAKVAKENRPSDSAFSEYLDKVNSILSQSFENLEVAVNGDTKYSIKYTTENKPVVVIEENILDNVPKNEWVKTVKGVMSEKFSDGIPISGRLIKVNAITRNEYTNSKDSQFYKRYQRPVYKDKFKSANNLDEMVLASTNYVNEDLKHERKDNFKEFARGDVLIRVGNTDYSAKVVVGFTSGKEMVLYDVIDFKPTSFTLKKVGAHIAQSHEVKSNRQSVPTNNNISQNDTIVNDSISENGENDTKLSIRETDSGEKIVVIDTDQGIFLNTDEKEQIKIATKYMNDNFKNKHLPLSDYNVVVVNKTGINKYRYKIQRKDDSINEAKYKASTELDNLLKAAEYSYHAKDVKNHSFAEYGFDYYTVKFVVGGQMFEGRIDIGVSPKGATFYGMNKIKRVTESTMVLANLVLEDTQSSHRNSLIDNSISQNDTIVNDSISEDGENDTRLSLKEDTDFGIDNEDIAEYNEIRLPKQQYARLSSAIMQKHNRQTYSSYIRATVILSDGVYNYLYKQPGDFKVVEFKSFRKDISDLYDKRIYKSRNRTNGYDDREGSQQRDVYRDSQLTRNRATAGRDDRFSENVSTDERAASVNDERLSNRTQEDTAESKIKKLSLLDDIEIATAKKAYDRNRKLQIDTKLVRKLFKDAGTVLDKSKTDAIANTIADRYEVTNPKYRELLSDKLYAYYTYAAREDASEAQTAIYGYELAQDIAAMSEEIAENPSNNFFEEYGESIYDVISLDIAKEYAEKAIIKAPKDLEQEHKEIADEYRKIKDLGGDTKAIYKALKDKTEELIKARKQYAKSRSEVMELRELFRKTKRAYERKLSKKKASSKAVSQAAKVVDNDSKSGIIKLQVNLFDKSDPLFFEAFSIEEESGFEDVCLHGSSDFVQMTIDGKLKNFSAKTFSDYLKLNKAYKGGNIRLVSCSTGKGDNSFAQQLSKELGVKVKAPDNDVYYAPDEGTVFIGDTYRNIGKWRVFYNGDEME